MKKPIITYYYRGSIEQGRDCKWQDGYSANGENGGILYPWHTRGECMQEAKAKGHRAVFSPLAPDLTND